MIREKLPEIRKSKADAMVIDAIGSMKGVVVGLTKSGIRPVIKAHADVVECMKTKPPLEVCIKRKKEEELIWERYAKEQLEYDKWKKESGYTFRWVFSEGKISSFKRMFGEEAVCRTQKGLHDEICAKFMMLDGVLPEIWR